MKFLTAKRGNACLPIVVKGVHLDHAFPNGGKACCNWSLYGLLKGYQRLRSNYYGEPYSARCSYYYYVGT